MNGFFYDVTMLTTPVKNSLNFRQPSREVEWSSSVVIFCYQY